jgi:hypothetical protein
MKTSLIKFLAVAVIGLAVSGCTNAEGRFRPIDPLGRAIFNLLDGGSGGGDRRYVEDYGPRDPSYNRRGGNQVWIEGAYARDSYGRQVWVPGHWARR